MNLNVLCFLLVSNILWIHIYAELTSVVHIEKGPVQGKIQETIINSVRYSSFRGIRYGKPPVGHSRFKPPEEAESWKEIFQATSEANPCPQMDFVYTTIFVGNEDCLNLNVYTPKVNFSEGNTTANLPVMVWIYGGSFLSGYINQSVYGPDFLIENEVVVVAVNYRIGVLGFLSLNHKNATGNAGLKDQLLALKWVQKNIEAFGGDPNSVTIFGQSAGAASVGYHVISDASKGLFHRTISMSGSPLNLYWPFATSLEQETRAFLLGVTLGFPTLSKDKLLAELYKQTPENLVKATGEIYLVDPPFKPTLEDKDLAGDSAFLTECPLNKYKAGDFNDVPHLMGYMAEETLSFVRPPHLIKRLINTTLNIVHKISSSTSFLPFFPGLINGATQIAEDITGDLLTDIIHETTSILFIVGIDKTQKLLTKHGFAPVYYYRDSFLTNVSVHKVLDHVNIDGPGHTDDIAYCWYISVAKFPTDPNDPFVITRDRVTRMWTNFAKYSNPTPLGEKDPLLNVNWPVSGSAGTHLDIGDELTVGPRPTDVLDKVLEVAIDSFFLPSADQCPWTITNIINLFL